MKSKTLLLFAVAAGCGLVAMIGAQQMLESNRGQAAPTAKVLVAKVEIEPGLKLDETLVGFKEMPLDAIPEGAIADLAAISERSLKARAFPGQVIQVAQVGPKGVYGTSVEIPSGMRLVSVPVDATMIHSGIMKPGDRVDIILTYQANKKQGHGTEFRTRTVLEYIQVFAMGDMKIGSEQAEAKGVSRDVKNVSLLVNPTQAQIINLARAKGTLHLTLRSMQDVDEIASKGTDENLLDDIKAELNGDEPNNTHIKDMLATTPTDPEKPAEPSPSFAEYLNKTPEPPVIPVKSTWKMEIYQGEDRKVHELELQELPANTSASAEGSRPNFWAPIQQWLGPKAPPTKPTGFGPNGPIGLPQGATKPKTDARK